MILILVSLALLQWWLSGRKSPVPGLILPGINLVISVVLIVAFSAYSFSGTAVVTQTTSNGLIMMEEDSGSIVASVSVPVEMDGLDDGPTSVYMAEEIEPEPDGSGSIGIIGGSDGPTAIFVTGPADLPALLSTFVLLNIPTALLLAIYFIRRSQIRRSNINKTLIQDL